MVALARRPGYRRRARAARRRPDFVNGCTSAVGLVRTARPLRAACAGAASSRTIGGFPRPPWPACPLYYRALLEIAEQARGHGVVRAARRARRGQRGQGAQGPLLPGLLRHPGRRLRRRLPHATRSPRSWASPTTGRSLIVGLGNLGRALANYRGFGARGFRIVALVDADPAKVGEPHRRAGRSRRSTTSPRSWRSATIAIGVIATPALAAQEVADRLVEAGVVVDPELRAGRRRRPGGCLHAQGRPRHRAADPLLLPAAPPGNGSGPTPPAPTRARLTGWRRARRRPRPGWARRATR